MPTLHFLQNSYKFVQEPQILQICYNVEHFLQDSDNIFAKIAFFRNKFLQKMRCYFHQNLKNHQITSNNCHSYRLQCRRLPQGTSKTVKIVNFDQEEVTCNFTPKVTITYSGNPPPTNNALIYTNAKPAHPHMSSSSNYDSMGNS